jgi:hypothetical protein
MATAPLSREYVKVWIAYHGDPPYVCAHCSQPVTTLQGRTRGCGVVHHKDEDRSNNDISNLAAMHRECHVSHHNRGKPGRSPTEEERQRFSEAQKKRFSDPELRKKLSEQRSGRPWSEKRRATHEARKAAGLTSDRSSVVVSDETREKMRQSALRRVERQRQAKGMPSE